MNCASANFHRFTSHPSILQSLPLTSPVDLCEFWAEKLPLPQPKLFWACQLAAFPQVGTLRGHLVRTTASANPKGSSEGQDVSPSCLTTSGGAGYVSHYTSTREREVKRDQKGVHPGAI